MQIDHQNAIYALRADARNPLTTAYTVSVFLGGGIASATTAATWAAAGWACLAPARPSSPSLCEHHRTNNQKPRRRQPIGQVSDETPLA